MPPNLILIVKAPISLTPQKPVNRRQGLTGAEEGRAEGGVRAFRFRVQGSGFRVQGSGFRV